MNLIIQITGSKGTLDNYAHLTTCHAYINLQSPRGNCSTYDLLCWHMSSLFSPFQHPKTAQLTLLPNAYSRSRVIKVLHCMEKPMLICLFFWLLSQLNFWGSLNLQPSNQIWVQKRLLKWYWQYSFPQLVSSFVTAVE